jgi:hypothetical protein
LHRIELWYWLHFSLAIFFLTWNVIASDWFEIQNWHVLFAIHLQ